MSDLNKFIEDQIAKKEEELKELKAKLHKRELWVSVLIDESGSMAPTAKETRDSFNEYFQSLKKQEMDNISEMKVWVTKFETEATELVSGVDISKVPKLTEKNYKPNGMTALLDAIMVTSESVQSREKDMLVDPKILFVVMTDGGENSSGKYRNRQDLVGKMIKEQEKKGNWTFVYLGANQDAWSVAQTMGWSSGSNVANYSQSKGGLRKMSSSLSAQTVAYACSAGGSTDNFMGAANVGETVDLTDKLTDEEIAEAVDQGLKAIEQSNS